MPIRILASTLTVMTLLATRLPAQTRPATAPAGEPRVTLGDRSGPVTIQLWRVGNLLATRAKIDGQDAGWFVVDTGASSVFLDPDVAKRLRLKPLAKTRSYAIGGMIDAEVAVADRIEFGAFAADRPVVLTAGIGAIRTLTGADLSGFIGGDVLAATPFTLDWRDDTLTFHPRATFRPPPTTRPHDIRIARQVPMTLTAIDGVPAWLEIDTGSMGSLSLGGAFLSFHRELLDGKRMVPSISFGAGGKQEEFDVVLSPVATLGQTFTDVAVSFALVSQDMDFREVQPAGRIGVRLLSEARVTFDYRAGKVWYERRDREGTDAFVARAKDRASRSLTQTTPLMVAAAQGRADAARVLLDGGADVNAADATGFTALMMTTQASDECLRLLIDRGADVDTQAAVMGLSALHFAAEDGKLPAVQALLAAKANPDVRTTLGQTPLIRAVDGRWIEVATALLEAGADVKLAKKTGETPLMTAAYNGDVAMIALLLDRGADVNQMTPERGTALTVAARERRPRAVELLLWRGASLTMPYAPSTALHMAALSGDAESAALLLAAGADPAAKDREGKTPLDRAAAGGRNAAIRILLNASPTTPPSTQPTTTRTTRATP